MIEGMKVVNKEVNRKEISYVQEQVHLNSRMKGFWDAQTNEEGKIVLDAHVVAEKLALIHSEVSEALEDSRNGLPLDEVTYNEKGKPEGFPTELADAVIRIMDLAEAIGIDLQKEILEKHEYNRKRPQMHGGKLI